MDSNGSVYTGEWKNDLREGRGVCKYSNGGSYDGEWKKIQGMGEELANMRMEVCMRASG